MLSPVYPVSAVYSRRATKRWSTFSTHGRRKEIAEFNHESWLFRSAVGSKMWRHGLAHHVGRPSYGIGA